MNAVATEPPEGIKGKKIAILGADESLAVALQDRLAGRGASVQRIHGGADLALASTVKRLLDRHDPEVLIYLDVGAGDPAFPPEAPADSLGRTLQAGMNLLDEARRRGGMKVVLCLSAAAYPKYAPMPNSEDDLWEGPPDELTAEVAVAHRALAALAAACRAQHGLETVVLFMGTLYGWEDPVHPRRDTLIPHLLSRILEARSQGAERLILEGTGNQTRDLVWAEDAADGVVLALERAVETGPFNISSGEEISLERVVDLMSSLVGFHGAIGWDLGHPSGSPRRFLDTRRARARLGFSPVMPFIEGARRMIQRAMDPGERS